MALYHPHENEQLAAITYELETAPQVQKQLKEKFGYGENIFFDLDLLEYRIHNSRKDIAQDLDVASLYGINDNTAEGAVGSAFRGRNNEEFLPEYKFEGLFGEELNDLIEESRHRINGWKNKKLCLGIYGRTAEERSEHSLKGVEARGDHIWSLDELVILHKIREESVGEGLKKTQPCWTYVTEKFNEQHGTDFNKNGLKKAYYNNKHRLFEEE